MPNKTLIFFITTLILCQTTWATDFSRIFKKVSPAVVVIKTKETYDIEGPQGLEQVSSGGIGAGVIISKKGLIMTAAHVIDNADKVYVTLKDKRKYQAKVIASSPLADVALIQLHNPPSDLVSITPSDSDDVEIGEEVFVIGAPYGLEHTLTVGHLSSRRISSSEKSLIDTEFLQIDAAINQGNSGGPLFTASGKLIGIVSHIRSKSGGSEGLGFCASMNMAKKVLIDDHVVWLGAQFIPLTSKLAQAFNIPYDQGLLVQRVNKNSLGAELGLRTGTIPAIIGDNPVLLGGDVIVELGGQTIYFTRNGRQRLINYLQSLKPGDSVELTVIREGKKIVLSTPLP